MEYEMRSEDRLEERYRQYQSELNSLEQQREDYERKRRRFEEVRERRRARIREDRDRVHELLAMWKDSGESNQLIGTLEDRIHEEKREEEKLELELSEELAGILDGQRRCEESYQKDIARLREEEAVWKTDEE